MKRRVARSSGNLVHLSTQLHINQKLTKRWDPLYVFDLCISNGTSCPQEHEERLMQQERSEEVCETGIIKAELKINWRLEALCCITRIEDSMSYTKLHHTYTLQITRHHVLPLANGASASFSLPQSRLNLFSTNERVPRLCLLAVRMKCGSLGLIIAIKDSAQTNSQSSYLVQHSNNVHVSILRSE